MLRKVSTVSMSFLFLAALVVACGGFYVSEENSLAAKDQLIATGYDQERDTQRLVVSPGFSGKAEEFGYVMPTPSRPRIDVRNDSFFRGLDQLTRKDGNQVNIPFPAIGAAGGSSVEVVETGSVGQYNYTVLKANSSESLLEWLRENEYQVQEVTEKNIDYYVNAGDYYFSAFKFDVQETECLTEEQYSRKRILEAQGYSQDTIEYRLSEMESRNSTSCYVSSSIQPIEFVFNATEPVIPARIMRGQQNHKSSNYTDIQLYTSSNSPLVVPGAEVTFSDVVKHDANLTTGKNSFLVEQEFSLDTRKVDKDIQLELIEPLYIEEKDVVLEGGRNYILDNSTAEEISYILSEKSLSNPQLKLTRHFREVAPIFSPGFLVLFTAVFVGLPALFVLTVILSPLLLILAPVPVIALFVHIWWTLRTWEQTNTIRGTLLTTLPGFSLLILSLGRPIVDSVLISAIIALTVAFLSICLKKVELCRKLQSQRSLYSIQNRTILIFAALSFAAGLVSNFKPGFFLILPIFQACSLIYSWRQGMSEKPETDSKVRYRVLLGIYALIALLTSLIIF